MMVRAVMFIAANIGLPHLFHLFPGGGVMFLPIYFFTAFAAVSYGKGMGVLTAMMSPLVGYLLFGAPKAVMLPDMMLKGVMLAVMVTLFLARTKGLLMRMTVIPLAVVVAWSVSGLMELTYSDYSIAFQDFFTGIPGMALMTLAGWMALLKRRLGD